MDQAPSPSERLSPSCVLCPRRCKADRIAGRPRPACGVGRHARVHAWGGRGDEGWIHFAGCALRCLHCPTPAAAWEAEGEEMPVDRLAALMLDVQAAGRAGLTLVNPGHVAVQVLEALDAAAARGFALPVTWRGPGYDLPATLALLAGRIHAYVAEVKLADAAKGRVCLGVADYPAANRATVLEMARQVGDRLLVRHMVLAGGLAGTREALAFLPAGTRVRLVTGYRPAHRADRHPLLRRPPTPGEIAEARAAVLDLGLALDV
ncbi:MAG: radical SAM protein [Pseudomonadota bacterium]